MYVDSNYWTYWLDERFPEHKYTTAAVRKAVTKDHRESGTTEP